MKKTITSLVVMPLLASAIFLASPSAFASSGGTSVAPTEIRNVTYKEDMPNTRKGIAGTVAAVNGSIIIVISKDNTEYTVDAANATIMKEDASNTNPTLVGTGDIKVGDIIMVRGIIQDTE